MRFEVKIDIWMKLIMYLGVVAMLPVMFTVPSNEVWIVVVAFFFTAILILPIMYMSFYELREDHLYIQMSIFRMKIKYDDITGIKEGKFTSHNNMALSLQAVIIERKGKALGTVSISPKDRTIFMTELKRRCPKLNSQIDFEF